MNLNRLSVSAFTFVVGLLIQSAVFASNKQNLSPSESLRLSGSQVNDMVMSDRPAIPILMGQHLPLLNIDAGGEVHINNDNLIKRPWSSRSLESKGKVQLVQYISANRSAIKQNKPFSDSLISRHYSSDQLSTTVIVNMSDSISFTKGFIVKKIEKSKAKHKSIDIVIDEQGLGLQRWGMKSKSCAIILLDGAGRVLFSKQGPMSEQEIESALSMIENQIS